VSRSRLALLIHALDRFPRATVAGVISIVIATRSLQAAQNA
jgi:hypothetical protein